MKFDLDANGVQDAVWNIILNRGEDTVADLATWEPGPFEAMMRRHPKVLIRVAG